MEPMEQPAARRTRRASTIKRLAPPSAEPPADMPAPMAPETHVAPGKTSHKALLVGAVAVVLTVAAVFGVRTFMSSSQAAKANGSQASGPSANDDVTTLVNKVAKHILIQQGETPAVATVVDPDSLRQQNPGFYKHAEKGDRLFIWSDKAILYSPSRDILLAVMPIPAQVAQQAQQQAAQQTQQADAAEKANIEIRNGSGVAGQGKRLVTALKASGLTTLAPGDAKDRSKPYQKTLIINVGGKALPKTLQAIQQATGGELSELPGAEGKAKGDVLVIIGADYASKQ